MNDPVSILAICGNADTCSSVRLAFDSDGRSAVCVSSPLEALQILNRGASVDLLLIDAALGQSGGNPFHPELMQSLSHDKLCILSAPEDVSWKQDAAKWNITKVLNTPISRKQVERLANLAGSATTSSSVGASSPQQYHLEELSNNRFFMAASPVMMQLYKDIRILASVDIPVLILGESGVGKENVAMLLHKYHARADKPLLNINCAALPNELLESELFGYEAGAFTGATRSKPGMFELANHGTLLLDEIGEMSPQMQAKLLHVLQDGSFCRLGARSASKVDVRVLAATNINMQESIAAKRFREDLYYRLNTLTITVPPLRERRDEIPLLMKELFERGARELGQPFSCPDRIIEAAQDYDWPGNLRELRNFVTRTLILKHEESAYNSLRARTKVKTGTAEEERPPEIVPKKPTTMPGMKDAVNIVKNETEIKMLQAALSASGWNRRRAATNLNISYRTLLYKIQQHRLTSI